MSYITGYFMCLVTALMALIALFHNVIGQIAFMCCMIYVVISGCYFIVKEYKG